MLVSYYIFNFKINQLFIYFHRIMDLNNEKSWMYKQSCKRVNNIRFLEGIEEFIQFAKKNISGSSVII